MAVAYPTKHEMCVRWEALKTERASWIPHWTELSRVLDPRLGRFFVADRNKGQKRHNAIYDNTATRALKVLAAGLMAGMTSPARPWFRLTTGDESLDQHHSVKEWLSSCQRLQLRVFAKGNHYRALHKIYRELGCFGTAANLVVPNFERVQHNFTFTAGEYALATDYEGLVNAAYREIDVRVGALVTEFGRENCSSAVRSLFDRGIVDTWVTIIHGIEPRAERQYDAADGKNMPYKSCYFEKGATPGKYLREGGFKRFRVVAPRWDETGGGDVYGISPGMEALGDIKQLQHEQLRKGQGIDYQTKPPIGLPAAADGRAVDLLPGGISYFDSTTPAQGSRQMFESRLDLNHLLADIQDVRQRINSAFFADLFLMLTQMDPSQMTATEVAERHEEKMLVLGPVLEQLHFELLSPMVEMCFADLLEAGALPPPPDEMNGAPLNIEFVSVLAQAQRAIGTASTDRFVGNLGVVAKFKPDVLDKFDSDKWADIYSDQLGIDPELIVPDEKVALVRNARAKAQQQAEATAQAQQMADGANKLANAPTQGGASNALTDLMGQYQGYNAPSAESF